VNTYFYVKSLTRAIEIAKMLGKDEDVPTFEARIAAKKAAIQSAYYNTWDGNFFGAVQGANAYALDLGLGDERTWQNLLTYYEDLGEFDTGIFGTELLLRLLFERGASELAVKLLTSEKVHSFAEMRRRGATTLYEHWPESYRDRSHSHPMFGAAVSHFYDYLLGIRQCRTAKGEQLILSPVFPPQLSHVEGYRTVNAGRVALSYEKKEGKITLNVTLPCRATLIHGEQTVALEAGTHQLTIAL
jgi:alpha-L-rhamnosidase